MSAVAPREYSKRLGVLTPEQLQAALDRFDLGTLMSAQPAPGGLFGQNVMIVSSKERWVLRGAPHYDQQFAKERYFAELIAARTTIPAPVPYHIDTATELFGWSYALMPWLEGDALTDDDWRAMSPDERVAAARAHGEGLAALQEATWTEHAWLGDDGDLGPLAKPYADWYREWTEYWLDQCLKASDATTADDVAWVRSVVAAADDALAVPTQFALVHTDYTSGNVLLARGGADAANAPYRVSGIVDLADCYIGDGEADLARMYLVLDRLDVAAASAFGRAYAAARPPREGFAQRWRHYVLRDRLIFWEYGQRNGIWFPAGMTLRDWAERFVELPAPA